VAEATNASKPCLPNFCTSSKLFITATPIGLMTSYMCSAT
jgi:hypothetical protein